MSIPNGTTGYCRVTYTQKNGERKTKVFSSDSRNGVSEAREKAGNFLSNHGYKSSSSSAGYKHNK